MSDAMDTAKIFWSGRSQAVRLPKEYRFEGGQVRIRRQGEAVILEPLPQGWDWLEKVTGPLDEDFEQAVAEAVPPQERAGLDEL
jgi:antitoxin VapB